jgi:hypothetical protein
MKRIEGLVLMILVATMALGEEKFRIQIVKASGSITVTDRGASISAFAKIILPNGDHADLLCNASDGHCSKIEPVAPEKMAPNATGCSTIGHQTLCTTHNLGEYFASRKGNTFTFRLQMESSNLESSAPGEPSLQQVKA